MYHEEDFGISAAWAWNFFATSHGKNACDSVDGTIKREAAKASLQAVTTGHLLSSVPFWVGLNPHKKCDKNVTLFFASVEEIKHHMEPQIARFLGAKTAPGTMDFHCFIPADNKELIVKRILPDDQGWCQFHFLNFNSNSTSIPPDQF